MKDNMKLIPKHQLGRPIQIIHPEIVTSQIGKLSNNISNMYDSFTKTKVGKITNDFMFGKDNRLSDEEYFNKYGYFKPLMGFPMGVIPESNPTAAIKIIDEYNSFNRKAQGGAKRVKFIKEHPVSALKGEALADEVENASYAAQVRNKGNLQKMIDEDIKYDVDLGSGGYGYNDGQPGLFNYWGQRIKSNINLKFSKADKSPLAQLAKNHELHHGAGNLDDAYIFNYLKDNGIVDMNNVGAYFKNVDRGEVSAYLSEFADYLQGMGKTEATEADVLRFIKFLSSPEGGSYNIGKTIFGNIKDMKKFVSFFNEHPMAVTAPILGTAAGVTYTNSQKENSETNKK